MSDLVERPVEIEELAEAVETVHDWTHISRGSKTTVSLVVRDMETREILGESFLYPGSGVYALVNASNDPEDPDDYELDRPETPEWVEWISCDPPIEHLVDGVRCRECGGEGSVLRGNPDAKGEHDWNKVRHDEDCRHATDKDKERAAEKALADEVRNRPNPASMALPCLYEEVQELRDLRAQDEWGLLRDPVYERFSRVHDVLERRLDPRYPECPDCGGELESDHERIVECTDCTYPYDADDDTIREIETAYHEQARRVWGWRGHGGRKPGEVT